MKVSTQWKLHSLRAGASPRAWYGLLLLVGAPWAWMIGAASSTPDPAAGLHAIAAAWIGWGALQGRFRVDLFLGVRTFPLNPRGWFATGLVHAALREPAVLVAILGVVAVFGRWNAWAAIAALSFSVILFLGAGTLPLVFGRRPRWPWWLALAVLVWIVPALTARVIAAATAIGAAPLVALAIVSIWVTYRVAVTFEPVAGALSARGRFWRAIDRPAQGLIGKELRYALRSAVTWVVFAAAGYLAVRWVAVSPKLLGRWASGSTVEQAHLISLSAIAVLAHLFWDPMWLNSFAYDGRGVALFATSPVQPRAVLVAKNVVQAALAAVLFLLGVAAYLLSDVVIHPAGVAAAFALHLGVGAWALGVGNIFSVVRPKPLRFALRLQGIHQDARLVAFISVLIVLLPFAVLARVLGPAERPWWIAAAWLALGLSYVGVYFGLLRVASRMLRKRYEQMAGVLARWG